MENVSARVREYISQILVIGLLLNFAVSIIQKFTVVNLFAPMVISSLLMWIAGIIIILVWKRIETKSPESLPMFFMAVSGLKMLAALGTLFICYLAIGGENIRWVVILFVIYYVIFLMHHAIFFAKINNKK